MSGTTEAGSAAGTSEEKGNTGTTDPTGAAAAAVAQTTDTGGDKTTTATTDAGQPTAGTEKSSTETGKDEASKTAAEKAADEMASWPKDGFPPDWQARLVATMGLTGDAAKKAEERAKRASSPAELLRSVMAADSKINDVTNQLKDRIKVPTGKDDKPEEVAAFRKALGIPETVDGYKLAEADKMSEVDKGLWAGALKEFHGANLSQAQVDAVQKVYAQVQEQSMSLLAERAKVAAEKAEETLRAEYGTQYKANLEIGNRFLAEMLTPITGSREATKAVLDMRFDDGSALGEHPAFVKLFVNLGKQLLADDGAVLVGDAATAGDITQRINEITKLAHSSSDADKREYERLQPELLKLIEAENRRKGRAA